MALAVTWKGDSSARFRSVVLVAATVVVTLFCCATVSAGLMAQRVHDRASGPVFVPAAAGQPADFSRDVLYDSIRGEPIFVSLWRIESPGASIPGIPADAAEGDWFVSPELERQIAVDSQLEGRFPDARPLGNEGVGSAEDLLAYRVVGAEFELSERLLASPNSSFIGPDPGLRGWVIVLAGVGLVLIVGIGFLSAALGPVGVGLERRLVLLNALGSTRSTLSIFNAVSTTVVTAPAAVGAGVAWYVLAPKLQTVPVVGERVFAGDLAIPAWLASVVAVGVVILAAGISARRTPRHLGSRPTALIFKAPAVWRIVPLLASLGLIAYSTTLTDPLIAVKQVQYFSAGVLAAVLSITFALPVIVDRSGAVIASGRSILALLIGRRLRWNAATSARPLMALAAFAVVVPVVASFYAVSSATDPPRPASSVALITFNGEADVATLEQLESDAGGVFAELYVYFPTDDSEPLATWVIQCDRLATYVQFDRCGPDGIDLDPLAAAAFTFDGGSTVRPDGYEFVSRLFITDNEERAEAVLRAYVLNNDRVGLSIYSQADSNPKDEGVEAWMIAGVQIAAVGALVALLLSVMTAASENAGTRLRLVGLGAEMSMIRRLAAAESAATVAIVGLGGVAVGTAGAVAYALVDGKVAPNYGPSSLLVAATLTASVLAGLAAAFVVSAVTPRTALRVLD